MTLAQAKALSYGQHVCTETQKTARNEPKRFKVNGKPKTWKREPGRVEIPLKYGLRTFGNLYSADLPDFFLC